MKKLNFRRVLFLLFGLFFLLPNLIFANDQFVVYFFYGETCPHCAKEEVFLAKLKEKYDFLEIKSFEVTQDSDNSRLLSQVGQRLKADVRGVPFTVVHEETFTGYLNDATTGRKIEDTILRLREKGCPDPVADIFNQVNGTSDKQEDCPDQEAEEDLVIDLPLVGSIDASKFSLPVLTVLIAAIDGFNPCAMWVLIFLISLLLGMKDRKRMWLLGGTFILASSLVYFLFLGAWLNLFLFIGFILWVRILIGLVAIGSGGYHIREFIINPSGACKVVGSEKKQKIINRMKLVTERRRLWAALVGIVLLAFAVNLIELVCSAGLPAVYAQILSLAQVSPLKRYLYLLLYIVIFMLDDMAIFVIAMKSLHAVGITGKYSRWSNLIGGILIFTLGILLIFKPEWIMFG